MDTGLSQPYPDPPCKEPDLDKKPEEYALEYAGFWIRVGAGLIDLAVLLIVIYFIYFILKMWTSSAFNVLIMGPALAIIFICLATSYTIFFWVWRGATLGKMIMGIKIIRTDSSPLMFDRAVIRFFSSILSALILCIGFIMIAFDERKQGLHDKIADTYVVKLPVRQVEFTESYAQGRIS